MGKLVLVVVAVLVVLAVVVAWTYNRLVAARNRVRNAFSQIDVQLKRRHDLIPNLVETAKGYLAHERETLEAVIRARSQAISAAETGVHLDRTSAAYLMGVGAAEGRLGLALTRFLGRVEAYPELKAQSVMQRLMEELATTENRIAFARQAYNDAVMRYNTLLKSFPTVLLAGPLGFAEAALWEITRASEREVVEVKLGPDSV